MFTRSRLFLSKALPLRVSFKRNSRISSVSEIHNLKLHIFFLFLEPFEAGLSK